ncbi:MAG TPA: hypothetical protein VHE35_22555 [Kofleriaceae bacterium]|nr:hypothetical protein [Kofleriaceae bacterium]
MSALKTRLSSRSRALPTVGLAAALALALAAFAPHSAHAQIEPVRISSASVGVASGQYVRLNAHFVTAIDSRGFPPGPCRVTLRLLDERGGVINEQVVSLAPGRAALLDYRPELRLGDHRTVRAQVIGERDANGFAPNIIPSLEVIDVATGKTGIVSPGTIRGFNPQPDPPGDDGSTHGFNPQPEPPGDFGLFGIADSQVARLTASYVGVTSDSGLPPGPCDVALTFWNGDGSVVATRRVTLQPGASISLDVPAGSLPAGVRRRMWTSVTTDGHEQGFLAGSVDIFDQTTGKSSALLAGSFTEYIGLE